MWGVDFKIGRDILVRRSNRKTKAQSDKTIPITLMRKDGWLEPGVYFCLWYVLGGTKCNLDEWTRWRMFSTLMIRFVGAEENWWVTTRKPTKKKITYNMKTKQFPTLGYSKVPDSKVWGVMSVWKVIIVRNLIIQLRIKKFKIFYHAVLFLYFFYYGIQRQNSLQLILYY